MVGKYFVSVEFIKLKMKLSVFKSRYFEFLKWFLTIILRLRRNQNR